MLNEKSIDKLIKSLIDRQNQIEMTVIETIAKRLGEIKTILPSDVYKLEILLKNGSDVREINKQLVKLSKLQEKEIKKIIKTVAKKAYEDAKPYYDYRKKPFIPYEENEILQNTIKAMEKTTLADYDNLSNATAFMMRDPAKGNFFFPTPVSKAYQKVIDMAIQSVVIGSESYNTVIPKAIKELVKSGIKTVEYTSDKGKKHYVRLDTVVKRNILDGIRNINHEVDKITGEQFGSDGVELSVHNYSAPDHEPIQGHRFTNEEFDKLQTNQPFEDENGIKFAPIERPIGVWNCHHIIISVILDAMSATYTPEQLEDIIKKNANGYTYINKKGEKITKSKYWCTQKMHDYELDIKKAKEGKKAAELAKEPELEAQYQAEIIKRQNEYIQFCKDCGLKPRFENTKIYTLDDKIKSAAVGVDNSAKSGIIKEKLNRDAIDISNIEPMPQKQFEKIQKAFENKGGYFRADKEANDYVVARNKEAITFNANTVLFRYNPSRAAVFEELIHTYQYRTGKFDGSDLSRCLCEIEAKEKLLKYAKSYNLTGKEIVITKHLLELDKRDLIKIKGVE